MKANILIFRRRTGSICRDSGQRQLELSAQAAPLLYGPSRLITAVSPDKQGIDAFEPSIQIHTELPQTPNQHQMPPKFKLNCPNLRM